MLHVTVDLIILRKKLTDYKSCLYKYDKRIPVLKDLIQLIFKLLKGLKPYVIEVQLKFNEPKLNTEYINNMLHNPITESILSLLNRIHISLTTVWYQSKQGEISYVDYVVQSNLQRLRPIHKHDDFEMYRLPI